ncbi:MAG TPA: hypothetical protein VF479_02210 [Pseudolysinimonas sp.]
MSLLLTYFPAATDELAAATIDWPSGPQGGPTKRPFRKQKPGFLGLDGRGVEPVVQLGMLEALLTGKSFAKQLADPTSRPIIATRDGGERLVIRIGDEFIEALAKADPKRLAELATPWSEIEEFGGMASVPGLTEFLLRLRGLAQHTMESREHAYCWLVV